MTDALVRSEASSATDRVRVTPAFWFAAAPPEGLSVGKRPEALPPGLSVDGLSVVAAALLRYGSEVTGSGEVTFVAGT
jgi:hypothetical protein